MGVRAVVFAWILASAHVAMAQSGLADAAMRHDNAAVRSLIDGGADVNAPQADGATALHWAAHYGDSDLARLLLEAGADASVAPLRFATEASAPASSNSRARSESP